MHIVDTAYQFDDNEVDRDCQHPFSYFFTEYIMTKRLDNLSFGQTLQKIRRAKEKTQRELAAAMKMDFTYFSKLENDRFDSKPTRDTIDKIAAAMECTVEERNELLTAAGRVGEEFEEATKQAQAASNEKPILATLFRSLSQLSNETLEDIWQQVQTELDDGKPTKSKKK